MRKKTFKLSLQYLDSKQNATNVTLLVPANDIADAVKELKKSNRVWRLDIVGSCGNNGIVLWKGKTQ